MSRLADWIAALAGVASVNPAPPPQDDAPRGFYDDDPTQPWFAQHRSGVCVSVIR